MIVMAGSDEANPYQPPLVPSIVHSTGSETPRSSIVANVVAVVYGVSVVLSYAVGLVGLIAACDPRSSSIPMILMLPIGQLLLLVHFGFSFALGALFRTKLRYFVALGVLSFLGAGLLVGAARLN